MIFKRIKIQNFFSFGPDEESLDLDKPGLYLITGKNDQTDSSNGAGKSSVFDAICFALFGKVTKDVNLPNIVNNQSDKDCKVELWFKINKENYWITRYRRHKKHRDNVYVYKGKHDEEHIISKAEKRDTQELINEIINFNYKSFINAVMMSQENISGFLQADQAKKKEIIENILQLEIMTKYHWISQQKRKIAKDTLKHLELESKNISNLIENTKQSMVDYIESCKNQKEDIKKNIEKLEEEIETIDELNIEEELKKIEEANTLSLEIENKMTLYQQKMDSVKSIEKEIQSLEDSQLEYREIIKSNTTTLERTEKDTKSANKTITSLEQQIETVKQNPDKCPLCENIIHQDKLNYWINENEEKVYDLNQKIKHFESLVESITSNIENWENKVEELKQLSLKAHIEKEKALEEAKLLKKQYTNIIVPDTKNEEELRKLKDKKIELQNKIKSLKKEEVVDKNYLNKLKTQVINYKEQLKEKKNEIKQQTKRLIIFQWWEDSLSSKKRSMKSWCISNIIGYFNARIKFFLDRFFDGSVSIQLDNELNETISSYSKERTTGSFSGGEKQRLNLSILFALYSLTKANISTKINIMFLDEILSTSLDDKGISTVLELLEEMKDNKETVLIVDHKDNFKDYPSFENIIIHKDKQGFSHIVT